MAYEPVPINTDRVVLSGDLTELTELLARNTHDVWSKGRLAEGWRWGPRRDDARKEHPCLVPYEALSNTEKEYDRQTALEAIKVILALGYRVEKP